MSRDARRAGRRQPCVGVPVGERKAERCDGLVKSFSPSTAVY